MKNLAPALLGADPSLELVLVSAFLRGHAERAAGHAWPPERARRVSLNIPGRAVPVLGALGWRIDRHLGRFDLFHHTDYAITPVATRRRVVTLYDTAWLPHREWVEPVQARRMERIVRVLLRGDPEVIALTAFARDELAGHFRLDPRRLHVTPLAADPVFSAHRTRDEVAAVMARYGLRAPYVIVLGTLEPRKNIARLVRAVATARGQVDGLGLVVLGRKGYRHEEVFAEARTSGLGDAFQWLGNVSDTDAAALVGGAAALGFPSVYEGFGLPAIEGMAAGVPVIASDIPVMREVCGDAALLVDTTRDGPLAEALVWAARDSGARTLAARGRAHAASFSWQRCAAGTLAAYRGAMERA